MIASSRLQSFVSWLVSSGYLNNKMRVIPLSQMYWVLYSFRIHRRHLKCILLNVAEIPCSLGTHRFTVFSYRLYCSPNLLRRKFSSASTMVWYTKRKNGIKTSTYNREFD